MFTIGCDPEIFLRDEEGNPLSAHGLIPGDKKTPHAVSNGAIQVDGLAVEFNTNPVPYDRFVDFNKNIVSVIGQLHEHVRKSSKASFEIKPVMEFSKGYLDAQPAAAKELGCDPDWCAYTLKPNPRPDGEVTFRTGSGHIHIGWRPEADIPVDNEEHIEICADFVKMLDATVGMVMTVLDRDPRRRDLYGKAGAFRPKPYGVEYRTPSNKWIKDKASRWAVWSALNRAITYKNAGYTVEMATRKAEESIQEIINTGDVASAGAVINRTNSLGGYGKASNFPLLRDLITDEYGSCPF